MPGSSKIVEFGMLQENGDGWKIVNAGKVIPVDIPFKPEKNLNKRLVTIVGKMGLPPGSTSEKLIAEKIISHESIAKRAYEYWLANPNASVDDNWFQAEHELLGI